MTIIIINPTYGIPYPMLCISYSLSLIILTMIACSGYNYPHFVDEETETQKLESLIEMTQLQGVESGFRPKSA